VCSCPLFAPVVVSNNRGAPSKGPETVPSLARNSSTTERLRSSHNADKGSTTAQIARERRLAVAPAWPQRELSDVVEKNPGRPRRPRRVHDDPTNRAIRLIVRRANCQSQDLYRRRSALSSAQAGLTPSAQYNQREVVQLAYVRTPGPRGRTPPSSRRRAHTQTLRGTPPNGSDLSGLDSSKG
jgi:hypothetical protein